MKTSWVACLLFGLLSVFLCVEGATNVAVKEEGFETIYLDYPSWITSFHFDRQANHFYVYGGSFFRQIEHTTVFEAVDNTTLWQYDQPFIDVSFFSHPGSSEQWAVGPSNAPGTIGYFTPLTVISPKVKHFYQGDHRGFTFSAVSVDSRNLSRTIAYWAGWGPSEVDVNKTSDGIDFMLVRSFMDLENFSTITWNNKTDTVFLNQNSYHPYHSTFKPSLYHDWNTNRTYLFSPELRMLYKILCPPNGDTSLVYEDKLDLSGYGWSTSVTFHWLDDSLFLGYTGSGVDNGSLISVDLKTFTVTKKIYFQKEFSNPRAVTGRNNTLYVGFEGGPAIVSIDIPTWKITGYARLPGHLSNVYAGWDEGTNHVYFVTHEQHSKIFRVDKANFCDSTCYGFGSYCEARKCVCVDGWELNKDKKVCEVKAMETKEVEEGAAIAMGILFALMTIVAGAGWFMFWRSKQQGYQRVL